MKDTDDLCELAYYELTERVKHFMTKSDVAFTECNCEMASYLLIVAERFSNELKIRVVLTAM